MKYVLSVFISLGLGYGAHIIVAPAHKILDEHLQDWVCYEEANGCYKAMKKNLPQ